MSEFRFRQFSLRHDRSSQKVGTDAVMLGAWAPAEGRRILDIGTGSGILALMMAQRNPGAALFAIEPDAESAAQAAENFAASPWRERMLLIANPLQAYEAEAPFDLILCNPPYFAVGLQPVHPPRLQARHQVGLSFAELAAGAARLLAPEGRLALILPCEASASFLGYASAEGLHLERRDEVAFRAGKAPARALLLLSRQALAPVLGQWAVQEADSSAYTPEYLRLTEAFYL
jgi:tRNA1Val (adenine37-N6)-methyltransferase